MAKSQHRHPLAWLSSWLGSGGNSLAMGLAATMGCVALVLVSAGGAWAVHTGRQTHESEHAGDGARVAQTLAESAGVFLDSGDVVGLRRVVAATAREYGLGEARVSVPGVGVVASARASEVTANSLPEAWEQQAGAAETTVSVAGGVGTFEVPVASRRGAAVVRVAKPVTAGAGELMPLWSGLGLLGALTLGGSVLSYYLMRGRLRGLGAIRESLHQAAHFAHGELPAANLRLSDALGPDAMAWNKLLEERDALRAKAAIEHAATHMEQSVSGGSDYASAFDALWLGMLILDHEGRVRTMNGAAGVFLGRQKHETMGKEFGTLVDDEGLREAVSGVLVGKNRLRQTVEVRLTNAAGEATVLRCTVRRMRREDTAAAMVVLEDMTQQRVADDSRNGFIAEVTHELRTPLTNIRLTLEQLVDDGEDPVVKARCLNVVSKEARRLERIVGDMLSVSEIEAGTFKLNPDSVRLEQLFSELHEDFKAQAQDKEIDLRMELPPKFPQLSGDRDKVMMALHNLVGNALKYTPQGGTVTVRVAEVDGSLRVDVSDNGIGIAPEEHERVFEKFYRSRDGRVTSIAGSGIGLALAREVVRMHGGDITLVSQVDKGSTFTLVVPLQAGAKMKLAA